MRHGFQAESLLTTREAAQLLGLQPRTLREWRRRGKGPSYYRVSARAVRYSRTALKRFLEEREQLSPTDLADMMKTLRFL